MRAVFNPTNGARFFLASLISTLLLAHIYFRQQGIELHPENVLQTSSGAHPFGTDSLGRDLLLRVIQGGQISLSVGILTTLLSLLIGVVYGSLSGWLEGFGDRLLMRWVDVFLSIPSFVSVAVLCLGVQHLLPSTEIHLRQFIALVVGISLTHWMGIARVARGLVMQAKRLPYVEAGRSLGASPWHLLTIHILPNIRGRLFHLAALQVSTNIMYESFMSFIGLGMRSPWTSWGLLVQEGWKNMSSFPHLIVYPSLALFFTIWSLNVLISKTP